MTRPTKKAEERAVLDVILAGLGVRPDREPEFGETPDFLVTIGGRQIGVEITAYDSKELVEGKHRRRQVESEWDKLKRASDAFRTEAADIKDVNAIFYFNWLVSPQPQHTTFMNEVADFIRAHQHELTTVDTEYDQRQFSTPLMRTYLQVLYLRRPWQISALDPAMNRTTCPGQKP